MPASRPRPIQAAGEGQLAPLENGGVRGFPIFTVVAVVMTAIVAFNSVYVINRMKTELPYMQGRKECLEIINYLEKSQFMQEAPESCLVLLNGKTWLGLHLGVRRRKLMPMDVRFDLKRPLRTRPGSTGLTVVCCSPDLLFISIIAIARACRPENFERAA